MLKLLSSLFALINKVLGLIHDRRVEEQGRQEVKEKLDENVAKAEAVVASPDPERDERLRNRFDRSRRSEDRK